MRLFISGLLTLICSLAFSNEKPLEMQYPYLHTFTYTGPGQIEIRQGKGNTFIFKTSQEIRDMFDLNYSNGSLKIQTKKFADISQIPEIPHIILTVNRLKKIVLEGDNFVDIDSLKTDSLTIDININGSTLLEGNIYCERFFISIIGSSQATIRGTSQYQTIYIDGPGLYDGKNFLTNNTNVRLFGASSCLVNSKDTLSVFIEGFGHVHYLGSPKINKKIKGKGLVSPLTKDVIEQFKEKK